MNRTVVGIAIGAVTLTGCGASSSNPQGEASPSSSPSQARVVGRWVGSCVSVTQGSTGSTIDFQLTLDLSQDGTAIINQNGRSIIGSYKLLGPNRLRMIGTLNGKPIVDDSTLSLTGNRMAMAYHRKDIRTNCSFVKTGSPQIPNGAVTSSHATSREARPSSSAVQTQGTLIGHIWEPSRLDCVQPWGAVPGIGITRKFFSFNADGTLEGDTEESPPGNPGEGAFRYNYTLHGPNLDIRTDTEVENWIVKDLTNSHVLMVKSDDSEQCLLNRTG
jgi:hypothetical protein